MHVNFCQQQLSLRTVYYLMGIQDFFMFECSPLPALGLSLYIYLLLSDGPCLPWHFPNFLFFPLLLDVCGLFPLLFRFKLYVLLHIICLRLCYYRFMYIFSQLFLLQLLFSLRLFVLVVLLIFSINCMHFSSIICLSILIVVSLFLSLSYNMPRARRARFSDRH